MQRSAIAALLAFTLLAWPASAQLFPTSGNQPAERVLIDFVMSAGPAEHGDGHCLPLGAGTVNVAAKLLGDGPDRDIALSFYRVRKGDEHLTTIDRRLTREPLVIGGPTVGGIYCYSIHNREKTGYPGSIPEAMELAQDVALRMTFTPQQ